MTYHPLLNHHDTNKKMLRQRGTGGMADTLDMALLLHSFLEFVLMDRQLVDVTNSHRDTKMKKNKTQKT